MPKSLIKELRTLAEKNHYLDVSEEIITQRKQGWTALEKEVPPGYMRRYRKHVRPACEGAILD